MEEVHSYYGTFYKEDGKFFVRCQAPYCERLISATELDIMYGWNGNMCEPCAEEYILFCQKEGI